MDSANKVISFVLGLVVVIVFLAVITGRFKLKPITFLPFANKTTPTPTLTPTPNGKIINSVTTYPEKTTVDSYHSYEKVKSIPSTGGPTILLPIAISIFITGIYFKKRTK